MQQCRYREAGLYQAILADSTLLATIFSINIGTSRCEQPVAQDQIHHENMPI